MLCLLLLPEWVLQVELWMEMVLERVGSEMALGPAALSGELHVVALVVFCSWVSGGDGFLCVAVQKEWGVQPLL